MINIKIICVGKLKEKSLKELQDEYLKRLSKYSNTQIIELDDQKAPATLSTTEEENIKNKECDKIIEKIKKYSNPYVIALDLKGKTYTSVEFAKKIENIATYESSTIIFVIGGSLGLTDKLRKIANECVSFSSMTFPHQLFRIFLLEQIFRSFKINNNETYHK